MEAIKIQTAKYRQENLTHSREQAATPFTCECGLTFRRDGKIKHFKTVKHINIMESLAK